MRRPHHPLRWILGALAVVVALAVGGPYVYINVVEGDAPEALSATAAAEPAPVPVPAASTVEGRWQVVEGSQAGYRVAEVLGGQSTTAVGRTTAVTGALTATATQVVAGGFTVDLTTVSSDQSKRDEQFQKNIMDTATHPTAVFTLVDPIDLGELATAAGTRTVDVRGTLAMHGATKDVTVPLTVVRSGESVKISGQIPVLFADYGIDNPSIGSFVKTGDDGTVEVLLELRRA